MIVSLATAGIFRSSFLCFLERERALCRSGALFSADVGMPKYGDPFLSKNFN